MLLLSATARATGEIQITFVGLDVVEEGYQLNVDAKIVLSSILEQALEKGISLYFVTKFSVLNPRWYWFDEEVARSKLRMELSYYALTRKYRLSHGSWSQSFDTLDEALRVLSRLRGRPVFVKSELEQGVDYIARLRMWLDVSRLAKPFQMETLGSKAWNLTSDTLEWRTNVPLSTQKLYKKEEL
ncbi:MAG: DUF4390 domain-containing protein [Nitrosomonas sp.]|nr:DUF4390 domain-containing protein [Nitrosomonas sp.]